MESERSAFLPDVPTFAEAGFDVAISSSRGYAFPAGTPDEIVTEVSEAIGEIMSDPAFEQQMTEQGLAPTYLDAAEYAQYWDQTAELFGDLFPLVREES
jgi:tripartite-type tricarboxylate transporter receptor subunit TctC